MQPLPAAPFFSHRSRSYRKGGISWLSPSLTGPDRQCRQDRSDWTPGRQQSIALCEKVRPEIANFYFFGILDFCFRQWWWSTFRHHFILFLPFSKWCEYCHWHCYWQKLNDNPPQIARLSAVLPGGRFNPLLNQSSASCERRRLAPRLLMQH